MEYHTIKNCIIGALAGYIVVRLPFWIWDEMSQFTFAWTVIALMIALLLKILDEDVRRAHKKQRIRNTQRITIIKERLE